MSTSISLWVNKWVWSCITAHSETICLSLAGRRPIARILQTSPEFWIWEAEQKRRLIGRPETHSLINALPFGDPAKRWRTTPIDGNPTFQVAASVHKHYGITRGDQVSGEVEPIICFLACQRFRRGQAPSASLRTESAVWQDRVR